MLKISNLQQLKDIMSQTNKLIVIEFGASWCGPCKQIEPVFQNLSKSFWQHLFYKINIDESEETQEIADYYSIKSIPTFFFVKNGKIIDSFSGADSNKLVQLIKKY